MTVLIVEDEQNILDMMLNLIQWESLGVDKIESAKNGLAALEMIHLKMPDIIISDIEMPQMDGIRMAEKIRSAYDTPPELIFLTCHAEFSYARKAVNLGAVDYILKPFLVEDMVAALSKAIVKCQSRNGGKLLELQGSDVKNDKAAMQVFLRELLDHTFTDDIEEITRVVRSRNLAFCPEKPMRLVAVGIDMDKAPQSYSKAELLFVIRNIIHEVLFGPEESEMDHLVAYTARGYMTVYTFLRESDYPRQQICVKANRLSEVFLRYLDFNTTVIVSEQVSAEAYADKREQMELLFARNLSYSSTTIFMDDIHENETGTAGRIELNMVARYLRERKKNELLLYMKQFLQREKNLDADMMKLIHHDLMQVFYSYLFENNISTYDYMSDDVSRTIQETAEYSAVNLMKYVSYMYDYVLKKIDEELQSDSVIDKARKYIQTHYMHNIGRSDIAREVMLAPNYVSNLFRKETGQTIREYINSCRVEEAKRRIVNTNSSITEIALEVGFDNISYFSTIFKKYTDLTPMEYRNSILKEQEK